MCARLMDLVRPDNEILAQHRDVHGRADGIEIGERPAEAPLLGEHTDDPGATVLIGTREFGGVGDGGELTLRRLARLHSAITPMPGCWNAAITSLGSGAWTEAALTAA